MNPKSVHTASSEREVHVRSGWGMLLLNLTLLIGGAAAFVFILVWRVQINNTEILYALIPLLLMELATFISLCGHFTLQPNEARVLILFGEYKGTVRQSGFWWGNPFYSRVRASVPVAPGSIGTDAMKAAQMVGSMQSWLHRNLTTKISLRVRNFNSEKLKVNDKRGNPIEIAAIIIWRVQETAKAAFDVDDFESYVHVQSEAAIRHIASLYAYDRGEDHEPTLRESADEVAKALCAELQERLNRAGLVVEESRLMHLAYAPEIAQAMLRRQQAEAVIAARQKIVQGAVGMVEMALRELSEKSVIHLDEERKAAMVCNLLVVLCSEAEVSPIINTGTLYP